MIPYKVNKNRRLKRSAVSSGLYSGKKLDITIVKPNSFLLC